MQNKQTNKQKQIKEQKNNILTPLITVKSPKKKDDWRRR